MEKDWPRILRYPHQVRDSAILSKMLNWDGICYEILVVLKECGACTTCTMKRLAEQYPQGANYDYTALTSI